MEYKIMILLSIINEGSIDVIQSNYWIFTINAVWYTIKYGKYYKLYQVATLKYLLHYEMKGFWVQTVFAIFYCFGIKTAQLDDRDNAQLINFIK